MAEIIDNHIRIEHLGVCNQTVLREAIVVIPRLHVGNQLVGRNLDESYFSVVFYHFPYLVLAESQHHVEHGVHGEIGADVIATVEVVHGDRTYSHHHDALEHSLE